MAVKLKDFVSGTLKNIIVGVEDAQKASKEKGAIINPRDYFEDHTKKHIYQAGRLVEHVEFDVAVTTSEEKESKGGLGVFVAGIGVGAQGKSDSLSSSVSRIKFSVPVVLPVQD